MEVEKFRGWKGVGFGRKKKGFEGREGVVELKKGEEVKEMGMVEEMKKKGELR